MGCDSGNDTCQSNEVPLHTVDLDAYFIDKYEVTSAEYAACIAQGACTVPFYTEQYMPFHSPVGSADLPVEGVTWQQASIYCAWEGKRLPTEAEWEKAARGSADTRIYPWGNAAPDCSRANFREDRNSLGCISGMQKVGGYPAGASPYGLMDMSGNVWEWVHDWYDSDFYRTSGDTRRVGPSTGVERVVRGGSWDTYALTIRVASRGHIDPNFPRPEVGFRCARSR